MVICYNKQPRTTKNLNQLNAISSYVIIATVLFDRLIEKDQDLKDFT